MRFWDRMFIWVLGLALLMGIGAVAYPEKILEIRKLIPLWLAQFFATVILSYPLFALGFFITDRITKKKVQRK